MLRATGMCVVILALLAGCQQERYRSMNLGAVTYDAAYQTAVQTLRDYYPIQSKDVSSGRIVARPKTVSDGGRTLVTRTTGRERAEMRIRREKQEVWADIRILVEHQEAGSFAYFAAMNSQHEMPNLTPAQEDAPFTTAQQEVWTTTGTNRSLERAILTDLYRRLHPE